MSAPTFGWFARDRRGVSATEFALLAPVLALVLGGIIDLGASLYLRFGLSSAVSAGANYAMVNASNVDSSHSASLSDTISQIVAREHGSNWATASVVVNNGTTSTTSGASTSRTGTASSADSCYCPSLSNGVISWGSATTCQSTCASGGLAGKFVSISASRSYTSLMGNYGFAQSSEISATSLVQVQ